MTLSTIERLERLIRYYRQNVFNEDGAIADAMHVKLLRAKRIMAPVYKKRASVNEHRYGERLLRMYA